MVKDTIVRRLLTGVAIAALAVVAFYGGIALRATSAPPEASAYAEDEQPDEQPAYSGPEAVAEKVIEEGVEQGLVVLGANQPLHIQTALGGFSGYERALIVASRLNSSLQTGLQGSEIAVQQVEQAWVIVGGSSNLITVNQAEADRWGLTREELAELWAASLQAAVDAAWNVPAEQQPAQEELSEEEPPAEEQSNEEQTPEEPPSEEEAAEEGWQPEESYKNKVVPIVSIGEGKRIGIARINGPTSKVDQVQVVVQLETSYKDALDVEIYVPISTKVPGRILSRVPGVGVTGVGDLRIR